MVDPFNAVRDILREKVDSKAAAARCQPVPGATADFPRAGADTHQLMLDEQDGHASL